MPTYGLYLSTLVHEFIGIYVRKLSELDKQTQQNAVVANETQTIALETSTIAKKILEDVNNKKFKS